MTQIYPAFLPGNIYITPTVKSLIAQGLDIQSLLNRHLIGDWGDICDHDKAVNDEALHNGNGRLFSTYRTSFKKIWILTEVGDTTVIMVPSDY